MDLGESELAIREAKAWLKAGKILKENGLYSKALYSLEMSLEVSMKGVLIAMHKNYPKRHDVSDVLEAIIPANEKRLPPDFVESFAKTVKMFRNFLRLRNLAGYSFEDEVREEVFESSVMKSFSDIERCVALSEKAVAALSRRR